MFSVFCVFSVITVNLNVSNHQHISNDLDPEAFACELSWLVNGFTAWLSVAVLICNNGGTDVGGALLYAAQ